MTQPLFHVEEQKKESTLLVVDKHGLLGRNVHKMLEVAHVPARVVLLSKLDDGSFEQDKNLVTVPYEKRLPAIPQGDYSHMVIVWTKDSELSDALVEFISEAEKLGARLILAMPYMLAKESIVEKVLRTYPESYAVIFGDIFGEDVVCGEYGEGIVNSMILQAKETGSITLAHMGMQKSCPVYVDDVVTGLLRVLFGQCTERIFCVYPKFTLSYLSVVRMVKKIFPLLRIDFTLNNQGHALHIPPVSIKGEFLLEENYKLGEKIAETARHIKQKKGVHRQDQKRGMDHTLSLRPLWRVKTMFAFLICLMLMPLLVTAALCFVAVTQVQSARHAIETGEIASAKQDAKLALFLFTLAEQTGKTVLVEASLVGKKDEGLLLVDSISFGRDVAAIFFTASSAAEEYMRILSGKSVQAEKDFAKATNALKNAMMLFEKVKAEKKDYLDTRYDRTIRIAESLVDVLPTLLGFQGRREYMVLLQNNMELRPTGGFIGSYALARLERGRVVDFSIHNVYDADGQLKGHIEPPFAIRKYIPSVHWYLRDSNFSPDFPKSASSAAFFLQQETGVAVDGVIGIDVSFVRDVLAVIGPINVSSYNEIVTKDNLYMLTQTYAEKDFFPGSRQKQDFLRSLFAAIQVTLSTEKKLLYAKLADTVGRAIAQKHVLFSVNDKSVQNLFSVNGLSSSLRDLREEGTSTVNDFLGISEANLGGNKANYFVKRKVSHSISIDNQGSISAKLTIMYKNTSKKDAWPGGDYKNYIRLLLPYGAKLLGITIDERAQHVVPAITDPLRYEEKNFRPPTGLEIEETQEEGKTVFGFLTIVPAEALQTLEIFYVLPHRVQKNIPAFSYSLIFFKQPGTDGYPYTFTLAYPDHVVPYKLSEGLKKEGNALLFSESAETDLRIDAEFSQR